MAYVQPTVADFKAFFTRDFPYGATEDTVMDADITRAISTTAINFNEAFFGTQDTYATGFLLLAAHFLVMNLRASSQGIAGGYSWLQTSKAAGNVSEGFQIPEEILKNPVYAMLSKTNYGAQYLMLILPQMAGQVFTVCGGTQP